MLYRKAYDKLKSWKAQPNKKALCIQGARQIGKTTVVREFGKAEYDCFVEFNFILDANARAAFDGKLVRHPALEARIGGCLASFEADEAEDADFAGRDSGMP